MHAFESGGNVHSHGADAKTLHHTTGVRNIGLDSIWHHHAKHPIPPQRLHAQGGCNSTVLPAGDSYYGTAVRTVFCEIIADPLNNIVFGFLRVTQH